MRKWGLAAGAALALFAAQSATAETRFERTLKRLDPADRLAQLCDYTAMTRIRKDQRNYRPDRAVANAVTDAVIVKDTIEVKGGAFRSRGKWYALTYTCATKPDRLSVVSFEYKIGAEIPQEKWASYGLWQ